MAGFAFLVMYRGEPEQALTFWMKVSTSRGVQAISLGLLLLHNLARL
jgi:hypothetical protein